MKTPAPQRWNRAEVRPQTLWLIAYAVGGVAFGWWLHTRIGAWGALLGLMLGVIAAHFGGHLLLWLNEMIWRGRPPIPDCRRGRCGSSDYFIEVQNGEKAYLCRCRARYYRRGLRFVEINADGKELPYLRWRPFRGWFPDFKF